MGRPLNHRYFGDLNIYASGLDVGGEGIASITLGGTNNSSGFTAGATQISIAAPAVAGGRTATAALVVGPAGALTSQTTLTGSGTAVAVTQTFTGLTQKATNGSGTGAVFTVARTGGTSYGANTTVTYTTMGTGYASGNTVTIDGALLGGVTSTNDLTITLGVGVAAAGTITSITITDAGAGYDTVPTVTLSTGTQGTLTVTAVLTSGASARDNAILCTAFIPAASTAGYISGTGGSSAVAKSDIVRQVGSRSYVVQSSQGVGRCTLKATAASAAGEMNIIATDSSSATYFVTKLTNRKAYLTQNSGSSGWEFATGSIVAWTLTGSAVLNTSVVITNA